MQHKNGTTIKLYSFSSLNLSHFHNRLLTVSLLTMCKKSVAWTTNILKKIQYSQTPCNSADGVLCQIGVLHVLLF